MRRWTGGGGRAGGGGRLREPERWHPRSPPARLATYCGWRRKVSAAPAQVRWSTLPTVFNPRITARPASMHAPPLPPLQDAEGRSRGSGIVEFDHPADALRAISMLSNSTLDGRTIHVSLGYPAGLPGTLFVPRKLVQIAPDATHLAGFLLPMPATVELHPGLAGSGGPRGPGRTSRWPTPALRWCPPAFALRRRWRRQRCRE